MRMLNFLDTFSMGVTDAFVLVFMLEVRRGTNWVFDRIVILK